MGFLEEIGLMIGCYLLIVAIMYIVQWIISAPELDNKGRIVNYLNVNARKNVDFLSVCRKLFTIVFIVVLIVYIVVAR